MKANPSNFVILAVLQLSLGFPNEMGLFSLRVEVVQAGYV
jgi:hypothetical protein